MWYSYVQFQASATKQVRSALFWEITQHIVVIPYRQFGTTLQSQQSFFFGFLTLEDETDRLSCNTGKELELYAVQYPRGAQI